MTAVVKFATRSIDTAEFIEDLAITGSFTAFLYTRSLYRIMDPGELNDPDMWSNDRNVSRVLTNWRCQSRQIKSSNYLSTSLIDDLT